MDGSTYLLLGPGREMPEEDLKSVLHIQGGLIGRLGFRREQRLALQMVTASEAMKRRMAE